MLMLQLLSCSNQVDGFHTVSRLHQLPYISTSRHLRLAAIKPFSDIDDDDDDDILKSDPPSLIIEPDEVSVGVKLCKILEEEYNRSIRAKDSFVFLISGGSMIKMLSHLKGRDTSINWSKCTMGFVSHRCVPLDDDGATFHKARPEFLDSWIDQGLKVVTVTGSDDSKKEALHFIAEFDKLSTTVLPRNNKGFIFDLLLIGLGIDGHIGSIYPNLSDVYANDICIPATSKNGKISLSIKSMLNSKTCVVACAGRSSKAPLGKAQAMVRAFNENETPMSFPASALRDKAIWLIDEPTALYVKPQ